MRCVDYTNCFLYRVDLPDDEQQVCSKHVEVYYWNKVISHTAYCLIILYYTILYYTILYYTILYYTILYGYVAMHGQQNIKKSHSALIFICTILYYTILYYTILYSTILYYTILYYTILYYTIRICRDARSTKHKIPILL